MDLDTFKACIEHYVRHTEVTPDGADIHPDDLPPEINKFRAYTYQHREVDGGGLIQRAITLYPSDTHERGKMTVRGKRSADPVVMIDPLDPPPPMPREPDEPDEPPEEA